MTLLAKVHLVKGMVFPVVIYGWESWTIKKAEHWRTDVFDVMLEKTLQSPLDRKEIQLVDCKRNQSWIFIGWTEAEAEAPILWPPDVKNWLTGKHPDAGKDWRQEEKGITEGWDGWIASPTWWTQVWASSGSWWWTGKPWGRKESDTTDRTNWTE